MMFIFTGITHARGPICYDCDGMMTSNECKTISGCEIDQVGKDSNKVVFALFVKKKSKSLTTDGWLSLSECISIFVIQLIHLKTNTIHK